MRRIAPRWCAWVLFSIPSAAAAGPETGPPRAAPADSSQEAGKDPLEGPSAEVAQKDIALSRRGIAMALRTGWGIPQGQLFEGFDLATASVGIVPVWLDLGYRFTDNLEVGIYAQYAFSIVRHCTGDLPCNASDVRFGFQVHWYFRVHDTIDPWVGIGAGFEIYDEDVAGMTRRFGGYEFVNLQLGVDFSLGHHFGLGPFASWSLGKFTGVQRGPTDSRLHDFDILERGLHSWLVLGLRLSFGA